MAALGWPGIPFEEKLGGAGMGFAELVLVLEELGRTLAPEPFLSTVLLAGQALALSDDREKKEHWLPKVCAGEAVLALAWQEAGHRYDLDAVATTAVPVSVGGEESVELNGEKIQVLDGCAADALLVSAKSDAGLDLFLLPASTPGVTRTRQHMLDGRGAALLNLRGVKVPASARLGVAGAGRALLHDAVDCATAGLCAEMLGAMREAFAMSLKHLKERKQFDVPIGSFQALKHRAANIFIEIELCHSAVMAAARALDAEAPEARALVSLAKAKCADAFILTANEAVQFFGGVGMTDEYDIGFYMKRARAAEFCFGDAAHHRARWATLAGY